MVIPIWQCTYSRNSGSGIHNEPSSYSLPKCDNSSMLQAGRERNTTSERTARRPHKTFLSRNPSGRRSENWGDFRQENRTVLCNQIPSRRTAAKPSWRKIPFRHELHFANSTSAAARRCAAMRLPEAAQEIFVKRFSKGRQLFISAAYRSELYPSWIFVQSNSNKTNPHRRPPERRCENGAKFSSRNRKSPRQNIAGII